MYIALLMEKFCDLNPSLGVTSANSNLYGSLLSSNIASKAEIYYYDEYLINNNTNIDSFLINKFSETKPDLIVVSYYPFPNDPRNISFNTFSVFQRMGIPVVFVWFDMVHRHIRDLAIKMSHVSRLAVVVDVNDKINEKFLPLWVPQDTRIFNQDCSIPRDIPVSFVGSTGQYPLRQQYIAATVHRMPLQVTGGQREHRLSIEEYGRILKRSKITLNFPEKADGSLQLKSRVYETMLCGTLLLEKENNEIKRLFTPMEDYVPFYDVEDLVSKVHYYLNNDQERERIACNGYNKVNVNYNSHLWWKTIIDSI